MKLVNGKCISYKPFDYNKQGSSGKNTAGILKTLAFLQAETAQVAKVNRVFQCSLYEYLIESIIGMRALSCWQAFVWVALCHTSKSKTGGGGFALLSTLDTDSFLNTPTGVVHKRAKQPILPWTPSIDSDGSRIIFSSVYTLSFSI